LTSKRRHRSGLIQSGKRSIQEPLEKGLEKLLTPFQEFIRDQTTASGLLLVSAVAAVVLAQSQWADGYEAFFHSHFGVYWNGNGFDKSIHYWINEGLMALFFFVIGLEIKRELLVGELKEAKRTVPIIAAAIGGMLLPALIYTAFNFSSGKMEGWGIPMATDTAFVIGVLVLLRNLVPKSLIIFITALAIIDDIGAILVIALFYSKDVHATYLIYSGAILCAMIVLNIIGIRRPSVYIVSSAALWAMVMQSGIHATIAGILAAMAVPARPTGGSRWFLERTRKLLHAFEQKEHQKAEATSILEDEEQHDIIEEIHSVADKASTPLQRWERSLQQPVALFVLPIFALANAGVGVNMESIARWVVDPIVLGVVVGLVVGKFVGITSMTWLAVRVFGGRLAENVTFRHIAGIGLLAGMGFTMSLFLANLSFPDTKSDLLAAKFAILIASLISGFSGYVWLRTIRPAEASASGHVEA